MRKFASIALCWCGMACAMSTTEEEPVEVSTEELKTGAHYGGGGLVFGNTPYGDCLTDCSHAKESCENENARRDPDDLMEPCDLAYSFCRADCQRAFPQ